LRLLLQTRWLLAGDVFSPHQQNVFDDQPAAVTADQPDLSKTKNSRWSGRHQYKVPNDGTWTGYAAFDDPAQGVGASEDNGAFVLPVAALLPAAVSFGPGATTAIGGELQRCIKSKRSADVGPRRITALLHLASRLQWSNCAAPMGEIAASTTAQWLAAARRLVARQLLLDDLKLSGLRDDSVEGQSQRLPACCGRRLRSLWPAINRVRTCAAYQHHRLSQGNVGADLKRNSKKTNRSNC
jgi:hypothetical protein